MTTNAEKEKESLLWDDNDIDLLLGSMKEYKSQKEYDGVDWEGSKIYDSIRQIFEEMRKQITRGTHEN